MEESITQKITPHLWFDENAEPARFYTSAFEDSSKIKNVTTLRNTPSGRVEVFTVELLGQEFRLINAGPLFKFNPSISFLVACSTKEQVDKVWKKLSDGGAGEGGGPEDHGQATVLMELGQYPFSEWYGWVQDRYGISWQVMFVGDREIKQRITPTLMFVGNQCGKAEEAINFHASVFNDASVDDILLYTDGEEPDKPGAVKHAAFTLEGQQFAAMDSARGHNFAFNEAISFIVHCKDQKEIDYYWEKLSADPKAEQCGWLKDKYGLSCQIVPNLMNEMLKGGDENKIARVTEAFLQMKKLDIAKLKNAYELE
ncbi:MAG: VOC family protein [Thermoproteota archaeon]|nr:VOC family protein [Thermoproteota archaeon]